MGWFRRLFKFEEWTYRELLIVVFLFIVLNLLAPRGFVQWILVQQDIRRVKIESEQTRARIEGIEDEIKAFKSSDLIKEQKLRELGYLKDGEISLEFKSTNRKNVTRVDTIPTDSKSDLAR